LSNRLIGILIAALACAGLVAGCGGDSDDETTVTLTKAEFIAQGDAICKDGEEEVEVEADAYAEENGIDTENPGPEDLETVVVEVFVPSLQNQADEIRELGLPEGAEEEAEEVLTALDDAIAGLEEDPAAAFAAGSSPLQEASEKAAAFGFEECGS